MGGANGISNAINNALGSQARPKQPTQGASAVAGALSGLFNPQSYQQKASAMSNALSPLFGSAANNAVAPQIQPQQTPQQQIPTWLTCNANFGATAWDDAECAESDSAD